MGAFSGRRAIIAGATGAIGQVIADRLVAAGATVLLLARSRSALEQLVREREWDPEAVVCHAVDLSVEAEIQDFAAKVLRTRQPVHVLVHAAGAISLGSIDESPLSDFDLQYQVNVRAPYQLTQALLPQLIEGRGQVVFINSNAGIHPRPGAAQYAATKYALRAIADTLREEVNERGVRVLSVYLGRVASEMQRAVYERERRPYAPEKLLQPSEIATVVLSALQLPPTAEVTDLYIRNMIKH